MQVRRKTRKSVQERPTGRQEEFMYTMQQLIMICAVIELLFAIPAGMILKRLGLSSWWALLCFVPVVALFGLWLLAFVKWPRDAGASV
jgi:uncharacterized membrane protein YhaH (DUF805 family)